MDAEDIHALHRMRPTRTSPSIEEQNPKSQTHESPPTTERNYLRLYTAVGPAASLFLCSETTNQAHCSMHTCTERS